MRPLALGTLIWLIFPGSAIACRTDMLTHQLKVDNAETAFVARVSSLSLPELKHLEKDDAKGQTVIYGMPVTVRLIPTLPLKGNLPKLLEISLSRCDGSGNAQVGREVNVYKINGRWRIDKPELSND